MLLIALETSCDETSVAVIREGIVLSNLVSSQIALHADYGGVVPELATREHLRNLPCLVQAAFRESQITPDQLEAVAATRGPGLPGALMVGYNAGQAMAYALGLPFLGVHHHNAHLYSPWIVEDPPRADFNAFEPNLSLVVSGGHTLLVRVEAIGRHQLLGSTVDDAAGECFDKVAKLIGLPYPGGPELDRLAGTGNPKAYRFPRPMLHDPGDDFSFSGLKTSVRYFLRDHPAVLEDGRLVRDLCASVQAAIVDVLVGKTMAAAQRLSLKCVTVSGGVARNSGLRSALESACQKAGIRLRLAAPTFCTDNAAMIGVLAERLLADGCAVTPFDEEVMPSWSL